MGEKIQQAPLKSRIDINQFDHAHPISKFICWRQFASHWAQLCTSME